MINIFLFLMTAFCAFPFARAQSEDSAVTLQNTLDCHNSYRHSADPYYEVFESGKPGLTLVRTLEVPTAKKGRPVFSLTFTDGQSVYKVDAPIDETYWKTQQMKVTVPAASGKKAYCVSYTPQALTQDRLNEFAETPPAACPSYPARTAEIIKKNEAAARIKNIQARIISDIRLQTKVAKNLLDHPGRSTEQARESIERLTAFNTKICAKIRSREMDQVLAEVQAFQQRVRHAPPAEQGSGAGRN